MELREVIAFEDKKVEFSRWWFLDEALSMMIPKTLYCLIPAMSGINSIWSNMSG